MSTTITTSLERQVTVNPPLLTVLDTETGAKIHTALTPDERRALADALRGREPGDEYVDWKAMYDQAKRTCDELRSLIEGQKEHVTKAQRERDDEKSRSEFFAKRADEARRERDAAVARADQLRDERDDAVQSCMAVGRERDAAVARTEAAEKRHTWPKTTPTGHTYTAPDTYAALCHQHGNAAQAAIESWDADECPPEPTWEMVGIAHREVERLQRDRDEWKARATLAEQERENWRITAINRAAPAVSPGDVEKAILSLRWGTSGPDSQGFDIIHIRSAVDAVCDLLGVQAEQAVDPVEAKAEELMRVLAPETEDRTWGILTEPAREDFRRLARHVLGQEATR